LIPREQPLPPCAPEAASNSVGAAPAVATNGASTLLVSVVVNCADAQATLSFNADSKVSHSDRTFLVRTQATVLSGGPGLQKQTVTITTPSGVMRAQLTGRWFDDGFHGIMGELLCAIEEDRTPYHEAVDNLRSLAFACAAIGSEQ